MAAIALWWALLNVHVVLGGVPDLKSPQAGNLSSNAVLQPITAKATNQVECWKQWRSYSELTSSLKASTCKSKQTVFSTTTFRSLVAIGETSLYTLPCETGITRVKFLQPPTKTITTTFSVVQARVDVNNDYCEYKGDAKEPDCDRDWVLHDATCVDKWQRYKSMVVRDSARNDFDYFAHTTASGYPDMKGCKAYTHPVCLVDPGADVAIIYWPPEVTSRDVCANGGAGTAVTIMPTATSPSRTVVTSAITLKGPDMFDEFTGEDSWPGSYVIPGPHTFVSPTVYLAHRTISVKNYGITQEHFSNGSIGDLTGWGETKAYIAKEPGIIPLSPNDVYSLRQKPRIPIPSNYPELVAKGQFNNPFLAEISKDDDLSPDVFDMLPFDYGNVADPVPASIYYDARAHDCWGNQSHCATITDGTYRPQLAFRKEFWADFVKDYWGGGCFRPEVNDPPLAAYPAAPERMDVVLPTFAAGQFPWGSGQDSKPQPGSFAEAPWPEATPVAMKGGGGDQGGQSVQSGSRYQGGQKGPDSDVNPIRQGGGSHQEESGNAPSNAANINPTNGEHKDRSRLSPSLAESGGQSSGIEAPHPVHPELNAGENPSSADRSGSSVTQPKGIDPNSPAYVVKIAQVDSAYDSPAMTAVTIHDGQTTSIAGKLISAVKGAVYVDGDEVLFASPSEGDGPLENADEKGSGAGNVEPDSPAASSQRTKTLMVYNTVSGKNHGAGLASSGAPSATGQATPGSGKKKSEGSTLRLSNTIVGVFMMVVLMLWLVSA